MRLRASMLCVKTSNPAIFALPEVGGRNAVRIFIVVLFPAPFGPRKPTTSPFSTSNEMSFTAVKEPYFLVRCWTLIIGVEKFTPVFRLPDCRTTNGANRQVNGETSAHEFPRVFGRGGRRISRREIFGKWLFRVCHVHTTPFGPPARAGVR